MEATPLILQPENHPLGPKGIARGTQVSTTNFLVQIQVLPFVCLLEAIVHWRTPSLEIFLIE